MKLSRLVCGLAAFTLPTLIAAAPSEFEASVQQGYTAQKRLQRIGLAPFACPRELDCVELEREMIEQLREQTGSRIVPPKAVRDLMTRASVTDLAEPEARLIIAEGLGVDAFAFVSIPQAEAGVAPPSQDDKWASLKREASVKRAELELRVIDRNGEALVQVSGKAQVFDSIRGLQSIAAHLFEVMLERAWR